MAPEKAIPATTDSAPTAGHLPSGAEVDVEASAPTDGRSPQRAGDDDALAMVGTHSQPYDPAVAARAVRKIDWFLIPAMIFGCTFSPLR